MYKEIKKLVELGFSVTREYKEKIKDWYTELSISEYDVKNNKKTYFINSKNLDIHVEFFDLDDAINFYLHKVLTSNNKGYIQRRLVEKKLLHEEGDGLYNPEGKTIVNEKKKIKKLIKEESKLVDEEFKKLNLKSVKLPTVDDAQKYIENAIKIEDVDEFRKSLEFFKEKFSTLDIYIGISANYGNHSGSDFDNLYFLNKDSLNLLKEDREFNEYNDNKELVTVVDKFSNFQLIFCERSNFDNVKYYDLLI